VHLLVRKTLIPSNVGTVVTRAVQVFSRHTSQSVSVGIVANKVEIGTFFSLSTSVNSVSVIPPMPNTLSVVSHGSHIFLAVYTFVAYRAHYTWSVDYMTIVLT
jgi:hypothetical protein